MSQQFPLSWFFIKNNNGYVLTASQNKEGAHIVISTLRTSEPDAQLWRHDGEGHLYNKETGLVMDVAKGNIKAGSELVLQKQSPAKDASQKFAVSSDGHICLAGKSSLVLGIKESFFSRSEGLHVHLQAADKRSKQQHWNFVLPVVKSSSSASTKPKRSPSTSTMDSISGKPVSKTVSQVKADDARSVRSASTASSLDQDEAQKIPAGTFPDTPFFLKSQQNGYFIGAEASALNQSGARLTVDSLRKTGYDSQLWTFDNATGRIINKHSGLALTADSLKDDAYVCQAAVSEKDLRIQSWTLTSNNELCLRQEPDWVLGLKDSWFSLNREGAHVHIQKKGRSGHDYQKFTVVLPVFKKRTVESTTTEVQQGVFPDGWFFVKNQSTGSVLTISEDSVIATKLNTASYSRQLWKYKDGFLINKASGKVLDVRGGCIANGAAICHYDQKKKDNKNQLWALTAEGFIYVQSEASLVLAVPEGKENVQLQNKLSADHKEQRWNFVLPVFKKKREAVVTTSTEAKISYRYAQYPASWFFIRSFTAGSTKEKPMVLTASAESKTVSLKYLDREQWRTQLWMFSSGVLINYATGLALSLSAISKGANAALTEVNTSSRSLHWSLTIDGYLVHGLEPSLVLAPQSTEDKSSCSVVAVDHRSYKEEHRWSLLLPEVSVQDGVQILIRWSVALLQEWRKTTTKETTVKSIVRFAAWPKEHFFISTPDGYALTPEKVQAESLVTLKKLDVNADVECFKWTFDQGYLVHVATGLVLYWTENDQLQLHSRLVGKDNTADQRQLWSLKTNGVIVSEAYADYGLCLTRHADSWQVHISDAKKSGKHYTWTLQYGLYRTVESRKVIYGFERIILMVTTGRKSSGSERRVVTTKYALFPKDWFFIRSKHDNSLVITASQNKEGAFLTLAKLDFKNYKRQLWRCDEDNQLINMETGYVFDVAGGKIEANCNVIQWHEKMLWRSKKNQQWGLSVDGHIHPQSRPSLVLAPKSDEAKENDTLQLKHRGALSDDFQQWSFAVPVFGKASSGSSTSILESVGDASLQVSSREKYERVVKKTIVRRWGVFPSGSMFIRLGYGSDRLALTVEQTATGENEYAVVARPMNFKEYKWQLWTYDEGHLINVQTGLALDGYAAGGHLVEHGLKSQLFVRERSESETQYWALGVDGEIHLKSNARLIVSVSSPERASVAGAQVGLRELQVRKTVENGRQELTLVSAAWMRWTFSKPIYGKRAVATATTTESSSTEEVEGCEEEILDVKQEDESADEDSSDEEEDDEEDDEDDIEEVTASTPIIADDKSETSSTTSSKRRSRSLKPKLSRKDSFTDTDDYVPTGFEKVVRYKTHTGSLPTSGYFIIKSELHGYVLDIDGEAKEGAYAVLTRLRSTDFASQLWSCRNGFLINLKGQKLALDASQGRLSSGERAHLSEWKVTGDAADQQWEHSPEGLIYLRAKRSYVLSIKELKRSDSYEKIDVFVQEEKTHGNLKNGARREQRWEILVPSLIPEQPKETGVKVVEAGKKATAAVAASTMVYKWFKELHHHEVAKHNSLPESKWFLIRYGGQNTYLAAGTEKGQVGIYELDESVDYKRFLWIYINGSLVNYKYMLRLVLTRSRKWILSEGHDEEEQTIHISSRGTIIVRWKSIIYYLRIVRHSGVAQIEATEDEQSAISEEDGLQLHVPVFASKEQEEEAISVKTTVTSWVIKKTTISQQLIVRKAYFPDAAHFFIKVAVEGKDDLVLAVTDESVESGITLQKLSYAGYKRQLWSFQDGYLINYGSKLAISFRGDAAESLKVIQLQKENITEKWILTVDGIICIHGHHHAFALGLDSDEITEGASVVLTRTELTRRTLRWKFAVPIFGKKKIVQQQTGAVHSEEEEHEIESAQEVETKEQETISDVAKGAIVAGVAAGAAAAVIAADTKKDHKEQEVQQHKKKAQKTVVQTENKALITITTEYWTIIRAWRIVFIRLVRQCKTKAELVAAIEESRRILYQRLDAHYQRHASVKQHSTDVTTVVNTAKDLIRVRLFEVILSKVASYEAGRQISFEELDIQASLDAAYTQVEQHFDQVIAKEKITVSEQEQQTSKTESGSNTATSTAVISTEKVVESSLVAIASIKTIVHVWYKSLFYKVSAAHKSGASQDEIRKLVEQERKQLSSQLAGSVSSVTVTSSAKESVFAAVQRIETTIDKQVETIHAEKSYEAEAKWEEIVKVTEKHVDVEVDTCQEVIISQEITKPEEGVSSEEEEEKQSKVTTESSQVVLQIVSTKFGELKTSISGWYEQLSRDLTWCYEGESDAATAKQDSLAVIEAAQVDLVALIEQTKFVIRSQYTTLSWLERRRIEYTLETLKASILASALQFREQVSSSESNKESILEGIKFSFGSKAQKEFVEHIDVSVAKLTTTTTTTGKKTTVTAGVIEGQKQQDSHHDVVAGTTGKVGGTDVATKDNEEQSTIGIVVEETKTIVRSWFARLTQRITERVQQGGDNTNQDIEVIISEAKAELEATVKDKKHHCASNLKDTKSTVVVEETFTSVISTVTEQTDRIKQVALSSETSTVEEISEKLKTVSDSTLEQVSTAVDKCKSHLAIKETAEKVGTVAVVEKSKAVNIVEETTKAVTGWLSGFIGRISGTLSTGSSSATDVEKVSALSEEELIQLCEQAKTKITTTEGVDAAESEKYLAIIESIRVTTITRITQVKQVATQGGAGAVEQLKIIEQESQQEITKHYHEATATQLTQGHVIAAVEEETKVSQGVTSEKKKEDEKSDDHTTLKVAAGAAAVAAGAAAISIIAGSDSEKKDTKATKSEATVTHVETGAKKTDKHEQGAVAVETGKAKEEKQTTAAAVVDTGKSSVVVTEQGEVTAVVDTGKAVSAEKDTESTKKTTSTEQEGQAAISVEVGKAVTEVISEKEQAAVSAEKTGKSTVGGAAVSVGSGKVTEVISEKEQAAVSVEAGKVTEVVSEKEQAAVSVEAGKSTTTTKKSEQEEQAAVSVGSGKVTEVISEKEQAAVSVEAGKVTEVVSEKEQAAVSVEAGKSTTTTKKSEQEEQAAVSVEAGKVTEVISEKEQAAVSVEAGKSTTTTKTSEQEEQAAVSVETGKSSSEHEHTHAAIEKHKASEKQQAVKKEEEKESSHTALKVAAGAAIIAGGAAAAAAIIHHEKDKKEKVHEEQETETAKHHKTTATVEAGKTETGVIKQEESVKVGGETVKKTTETIASGVATGVTEETGKKKEQEAVQETTEHTDASAKSEEQQTGKSSSATTTTTVMKKEEEKEEQVVSATVIASQSIVAQKVSCTVQDLRVTIREWYSALVERVSAQSGKTGATKAQIEAIIQGETDAINKHIEVSSGKIRESFTSETETKELEATLTWIKSTVTKSTTQVQDIAVQAVSGSTTTNGAAQLQAIAASHQQEIEEAFIQCEHKIKKVATATKTTHVEEEKQKHKKESAAVHEKVEQGKSSVPAAVIKPAGQVVTISAVEYVKVTVRSWFSKLMEDVSARVVKGGKTVSADVEAIIAEANKHITAELTGVCEKADRSGSKDVAAQLVSTTEWTKGMVLQGSNHIKTISVQAIASGESSAVSIKERMSGYIQSTQQQIETAYASCGTSLSIQVEEEKTVAHGSIELVEHDAHAIKAEKEKTSKKTGGSASSTTAIVSVGAAEHIQVTIRSWFQGLIRDVSARAAKGGQNASEEISVIVAKATESITAQLSQVTAIIEASATDKAASQKLTETVQWAKDLVVQSSTQVQAIGVQVAASGSTNVSAAYDRMKALVESTQTQISTAVERCDTSLTIQVEEEQVTKVHESADKTEKQQHKETVHHHKKTKTSHKDAPHHQDSTTGAAADVAVVGAAVVTVGVVEHVKTTVRAWYRKLMEDVAERAAKGGENAAADIEIIVEKANKTIEAEIKHVCEKTTSHSSNKNEQSVKELVSTTEWAKGLVLQGSAQIKQVGIQVAAAGGAATVSTVKERMSGYVEVTETQISTAFEKCDTSIAIQVEANKHDQVAAVEKKHEKTAEHKKADIEEQKKHVAHKEHKKVEEEKKKAEEHKKCEDKKAAEHKAKVEEEKKAEEHKKSEDKKTAEHKAKVEEEKKAEEHKKTKVVEHKKTKSEEEKKEVAKKVTGALVTVTVVEHVRWTIRAWFEKLMQDVAVRASKGGANANQEIEAIVAEANKTISLQFADITTSCKASGNKVAAQKVSETLQWAKGLIVQGSAQVKAIGVQACAAHYDATTAHKHMEALVEATQTQISTALETCDESLTIQVSEVKHRDTIEKKDKRKPATQHHQASSAAVADATAAAGAVVVSISVVEHVKVTIRSWYQKLMDDVATCAARGGSSQEIEIIVAKAKEQITAELSGVCEQVDRTETSSSSASQIKSTTQWIKDMVLQSSEQVKAIGVQVIAAGGASVTSVKEQMSGLVTATETQITTALSQCDSKVTVSVDKGKKTVLVAGHHSEKKKTTASIKDKEHHQEKKAEHHDDKKDRECHKDKKGEHHDDKKDRECRKDKKPEHHEEKKAEHHQVKKVDTHKEKKSEEHHDVAKHTGAIVGGVAAGIAVISTVDYIKVVVRSWYEKLMKDVSERAAKGGENVSQDIEVIVAKANEQINAHFEKIGTKVTQEKGVKDSTASVKLSETLTWAKSTITQSSSQIQAVGIQAAASGIGIAGARQQIKAIVESTQAQINTAVDTCDKSVTIEIDTEEKEQIEIVEKKHAHEKVVSAPSTEIVTGAVTVSVVEHVKITVHYWFRRLVDDVAVRAAKGGADASADIEVIIAKANEQITAELAGVCDKAGQDTTSETVKQLKSTTEWAKGLILQGSAQIKQVGLQVATTSGATIATVHERISSSIGSIEEQIDTELEKCDNKVTIQVDSAKAAAAAAVVAVKEHRQAVVAEKHEDVIGSVAKAHIEEGVTVSVGVIDHVKATVNSWFQRLVRDITECSAKGGKQEEIEAIVAKANATITAQFSEITVKTEHCEDKASAKRLTETLEWAKGVASQGAAQIQAIGIQASAAGASAAAATYEQQIKSLVEATEQQINTAVEHTEVDLAIEVVKDKKEAELIEKQKKESKKVVSKHTDDKKSCSSSVLPIAAGAIVVGGVVAVSAAEHVKASVSSWLQRLTSQVSARAAQGGENASQEIEAIVAKANESIEAELATVCDKAEHASDEKVKQQLISTAERAKKLVLESSAQIKQVGVQVAATGGATAEKVKEQLASVVQSTETQVSTALASCDESITVEVDKSQVEKLAASGITFTVTAASQVKAIVSAWFKKLTSDVAACAEKGGENASQEIQLIVAQAKESIAAQLAQTTTSVTQVSKVTESESQEFVKVTEWAKGLLLESTQKIETVGIKAAKEGNVAIFHEEVSAQVNDIEEKVSTALDKCDSKKLVVKGTAGALAVGTVSVSVVDHIKKTVRAWYLRLIEDVSSCATRKDENASVEIERIVAKAKESFSVQIAAISEKTKTIKDQETATKLTSTLEWAKDVVLQGSTQVQAVGVQAVSTGASSGGLEEMKNVFESIEKQVDVAFGSCDSSVEIEVLSSEKALIEETLTITTTTIVKQSTGKSVAAEVTEIDDSLEVIGEESTEIGKVEEKKDIVETIQKEESKKVAQAETKVEQVSKVEIEQSKPVSESKDKETEKSKKREVSKAAKEQPKPVSESKDKDKAEESKKHEGISAEKIIEGGLAIGAVGAVVAGAVAAHKAHDAKESEKSQKHTSEKVSTGEAITVGAGKESTKVEEHSKTQTSIGEKDKATRVTKDEAIKVDVEKQTKDTESKKVEEDLSKTKVSVGEKVETSTEVAKDEEKKVDVEKQTKDTASKAEKVSKTTEQAVIETEIKESAKVDTSKAAAHDKKEGITKEQVIEGGLAIGAVGAVVAGAVAADKEADKKSTGEQTTGSVGKISGTTETSKSAEIVILDEKTRAQVVETAQQAAVDIRGWFSVWIEKITSILEVSDCSDAQHEVKESIAEAETELAQKITELKKTTGSSEAHLDVFYDNLHATVSEQLTAVRASVVETQVQDKSQKIAALSAITSTLTEKVTAQVTTVKEKTTTAVSKKTGQAVQDVTKTVEDKVHRSVQVVSAENVIATKTKVNGWFARLTERIVSCYKQGGEDVSNKISAIIAESEEELKVIVSTAKDETSQSKTTTTTVAERDYAATLDWVYATATAQVTTIKTITTQSIGRQVDIEAQLNNVTMVSKKQIDQALQVHTVTVESESHDTQKQQQESNKDVNVVAVVRETAEEARERTQKEMALIVQETQVKLSGWLEVLIKNIKALLRRENCDIEKELAILIAAADQDSKLIFEDAKTRLVSVSDSLAASHVDIQVASIIAKAQAQTLNCLDTTKSAVWSKITTLQHLVSTSREEDITVIEERINNRATLIKQSVDHSLEYVSGAVITAAYEGKTVTLVESTEIPESFKTVRAFAFDLVGTVADYRASVARVWQQILKTKTSKHRYETVDLNAFADQWYLKFLERKKTLTNETDQALVRLILIELLKEHSLECAFEDHEVDLLCGVWRRLSLFQDASAGIRRIKSQQHGGMIAVSFSPSFSTSTLVDLARTGCLCLHAQFGADILTSIGSSNSVESISRLLGLQQANNLAVVSANAEVLKIAKEHGARTVHIRRSEEAHIGSSETAQFDVEMDGLDMLAESFEVMLEQEEIKQVSSTAPSPSRSWFQRIVDTASGAAETVQKAVIG